MRNLIATDGNRRRCTKVWRESDNWPRNI